MLFVHPKFQSAGKMRGNRICVHSPNNEFWRSKPHPSPIKSLPKFSSPLGRGESSVEYVFGRTLIEESSLGALNKIHKCFHKQDRIISAVTVHKTEMNVVKELTEAAHCSLLLHSYTILLIIYEIAVSLAFGLTNIFTE